MENKCLVWFRKDLRLHDNPAINAAKEYQQVYPIYIMDDDIYENKYLGSASIWWLKNSLKSLNFDMKNTLKVVHGDSLKIIPTVCEDLKINAVFWNRCYEFDRVTKDKKLKEYLLSNNIEAKSFNANLLWEPWTIKNKSGNPYKVFTPFYKSGCLQSVVPRKPIKKPEKISFKKIKTNLKEHKFSHINQKDHWSNKFLKYWEVGEIAANKNFDRFLENGAKNYSTGRNFPSTENVSRLSPYLHWGQISPFRVWHEAKNKMFGSHKEIFLSELGWREFSYHLLYHYPKINKQNLKEQFNKLDWNVNDELLLKWKKGKTGFPIVDAGMRELWETGYMHNRLRMITASFLVKNLLIHWKEGEKWFWDCLLDADLANNSASWQWVAGTGSDAAPFFRIFNPITQGQKFDKDALYIRKYLPEIAKLPNKFIFTPWLADKEILKDANVTLGVDYPHPIIDYTSSRKKALEAFKKISN